MKYHINQNGYTLLQCIVALLCAGIAFSLLLILHIKSLHHQKKLQAHAWTLIHVSGARHIQHAYSASAVSQWENSLEKFVPAAKTNIHWQSTESIHICWNEGGCWKLE